ncbi:hypothetical protein TRVL_05521 [Trypanosoma vivax]|nr:hypothetical protein TRVL_05521 [Trypanosoma vivax]
MMSIQMKARAGGRSRPPGGVQLKRPVQQHGNTNCLSVLKVKGLDVLKKEKRKRRELHVCHRLIQHAQQLYRQRWRRNKITEHLHTLQSEKFVTSLLTCHKHSHVTPSRVLPWLTFPAPAPSSV